MAITRVSALIKESYIGQKYSDLSPDFRPKYDEQITEKHWDEYYSQVTNLDLIRHHFGWIRKGAATHILYDKDIVIQKSYPTKVYVHRQKVSDPTRVVGNNTLVIRPRDEVNASYLALSLQYAINQFCEEHDKKIISLIQVRSMFIDYDEQVASKVQRRHNSFLNALREAKEYKKVAMELIESSNAGIEQEVVKGVVGKAVVKKSHVPRDCPHSFKRDHDEIIDGKSYVICKCILCDYEKRLAL